MKIGGRDVVERAASGRDVLVIAELGVNHDGSARRAVEMAHAAADAGADAIKLQLFDADLLMSASAKLAVYQKAAGETDPIAMLRRLQLSAAEMGPVIEAARSRGLAAIVTVFSVQLVEEAERLGWDGYKTASPDVIHKPLLEALSATGKPLIVSTGASTAEEVERAAEWLSGARAEGRLAVLQCVSSYPARDEDAAVGAMEDLRARVKGVPIGYSDHTAGEDTGALAVALGASVLEKHLTYDRTARGPDHAASLDPAGFRRYVERVRGARARDVAAWAGGRDVRIGDGVKRVLACEQDVRAVSRQSVVTARAIGRGERIGVGDVVVKRPGTGLAPERMSAVIGRRATRDLAADVVVVEGDVEG